MSFTFARLLVVAGLLATPLAGGACDRTIREKETVTRKRDGTVTRDRQTVKEKSDGSIVVERDLDVDRD